MNSTDNKKALIPFIIALVGSILMAITLILPYSTAIDDHAEYINNHPDEIVYEELDIYAEDTMDISMVEYANIYGSMSEKLWGDSFTGTLYIALVVLIGGFSVLAVLFSILKKPIAVIIFDVLAYLVFCIQNWDYTDRGVVPSSGYDWGAGYYIFHAAAVITFVGAVWMLVNKIRMKKQLNDSSKIK